jgi:uncharacterized protein YbjT (DUF2867 family)
MASLCPHPASLLTRARVSPAAARSTRRAAPARCAAVPADDPRVVGRRDAISAGVVASLLAAVDVGVAAQPAAAEPLAGASDGPVLVVGATGNTGRRVVEQLRARGVAVRAASRKPEKMRALGLEAAGAELVALDVLDPDSIASAMAGASAVVCCTGFTPSLNFKKDNPAKVDHVGTDNLVAAAGTAKGGGVKKFVLVTSLLTNARAAGQADNDNYKFLNALGGVLDEKLAAELNLRGSGLDYTIVRPGGLSNEPESVTGPVIVRGEDTTFGLPTDPGREISRDTVAAVCVEALFAKNASNRVVEIVASPDAPETSPDTWFA